MTNHIYKVTHHTVTKLNGVEVSRTSPQTTLVAARDPRHAWEVFVRSHANLAGGELVNLGVQDAFKGQVVLVDNPSGCI